MPSAYQRRIKKSYESLPTKLKFKALIKCNKNRLDTSLVINSLTREEMPAIRKLLARYNELPFLYYERLVWSLKFLVLWERESHLISTRLSLLSIKENIHLIESLNQMNEFNTQNKYITTYCADKKRQLKKIKGSVASVHNALKTLSRGKEEVRHRLSEVQNEIEAIETEIGFRYPFWQEFELPISHLLTCKEKSTKVKGDEKEISNHRRSGSTLKGQPNDCLSLDKGQKTQGLQNRPTVSD